LLGKPRRRSQLNNSSGKPGKPSINKSQTLKFHGIFFFGRQSLITGDPRLPQGFPKQRVGNRSHQAQEAVLQLPGGCGNAQTRFLTQGPRLVEGEIVNARGIPNFCLSNEFYRPRQLPMASWVEAKLPSLPEIVGGPFSLALFLLAGVFN